MICDRDTLDGEAGVAQIGRSYHLQPNRCRHREATGVYKDDAVVVCVFERRGKVSFRLMRQSANIDPVAVVIKGVGRITATG